MLNINFNEIEMIFQLREGGNYRNTFVSTKEYLELIMCTVLMINFFHGWRLITVHGQPHWEPLYTNREIIYICISEWVTNRLCAVPNVLNIFQYIRPRRELPHV